MCAYVCEWWSEYVSEWMREWVINWASEWVSEWVCESEFEWVSEWVGVGERVRVMGKEEWKWVSLFKQVSEWTCEWVSEWVYTFCLLSIYPQYLCKSHDHDHKWTDYVMSVARLVWDFCDILSELYMYLEVGTTHFYHLSLFNLVLGLTQFI